MVSINVRPYSNNMARIPDAGMWNYLVNRLPNATSQLSFFHGMIIVAHCVSEG
jgi:hypothetical protein